MDISRQRPQSVRNDRRANAGPGYHAAIVDMLDHLVAKLSLQWDWQPDGATDKAGYATQRDFGAVQTVHERFFLSLMQIAQKTEDGSFIGFAFCTPEGLSFDNGGIRCTLGEQPLDWPARVKAAGAEGQRAAAATFFVWWDAAQDAIFWQALLRAQLWQNANWRPRF